MLDAYYLREGPLPFDPREIARLIRLRNNMDEIESVLSEFFVLTDSGWVHTRCDAEIVRMKDKQAKAKASAAASVNARLAKVQRTLNERSTDVELPTPTPTPTPVVIDAPQRAANKRGTRLPQDWLLPKAWGEWALSEFKTWTPDVVRVEADKFRDFWHGKAGRDATKADWQATWRNWCRNAKPNVTPAQTAKVSNIFAGAI